MDVADAPSSDNSTWKTGGVLRRRLTALAADRPICRSSVHSEAAGLPMGGNTGLLTTFFLGTRGLTPPGGIGRRHWEG